MRVSVASLSRKVVAVLAAFVLMLSMAPVAWADDGPAGTIAGTVAGSTSGAEGTEGSEGASSAEGPTGTGSLDAQTPEAEARSANAKAADGTGDAGTGTTIKIAVYRSSYPLVWDLNDAGAPDETRAKWADPDGRSAPDWWPKEASPGSKVDYDEASYVPWTDDKDPGSEPSRTGFNFMGWSTSPTIAVEGAGKLSSLSIPKGTEPVAGEDGVKRITLYALWAPINYSVVFDLTKNPEDASAVPSFNWTTGKGTFSDLGGGRYRLSGVTLEDYDPATGLIEISTPSRGTGGYRFLSWAEPDSQQDPTIAVKRSGSSKWYVNPVALPHYDYEPVLTARWSLSFDVDVPSQITFDEYDSLEVEGNLTDTTDEDAIDEESPDAHDKGKKAHFCSQSTATDYKIVALRSVRQPTASDVLTSSDTVSEGGKYTQDYVLGQERLLSLFAEGATEESQGVHFKLDDAVDMDDSARYGSFVIPKQQAPFDPSATERDDESRLYVSYRLNLSNKVGDSETPNHGLVTPGNVSEGDRTPIAAVSYEFAVADDAYGKPAPYIEPLSADNVAALSVVVTAEFLEQNTGAGDWPLSLTVAPGTYGLQAIKMAANDLSAHGGSPQASRYYWLYRALLDAGVPFHARIGGRAIDLQLIGIAQDVKVSGEKAGLSFQTKDIYANENKLSVPAGGTAFDSYMKNGATNSGGWNASDLRPRLNTTFLSSIDAALRKEVVPVVKYQQLREGEVDSATGSELQASTAGESVWIPSLYEVYGIALPGFNDAESDSSVAGYRFFQYHAYERNVHDTNSAAIKSFQSASGVKADYWWLRSAYRSNQGSYCMVGPTGKATIGGAGGAYGVAPGFCL